MEFFNSIGAWFQDVWAVVSNWFVYIYNVVANFFVYLYNVVAAFFVDLFSSAETSANPVVAFLKSSFNVFGLDIKWLWVALAVVGLLLLIIVISIIAGCAKSKKKKAAKKAEQAAQAVAEQATQETAVEEAPKAEETPAEETPVEAPVEEAPKAEEAPVQEEAAIAEEPAQEEKPVKKTTSRKKKAAPVEEAPKAEEAPVVAEAPVEEVKEEPAQEEKAEEPATKAPRYSGKWVITKVILEGEGAERYFFELKASNGQILLTSWEYNTHQGALRGIETYKTNIEKGHFRIYETKKKEFFFKLLTSKNTLLGTGANYPTKEACEKTVESVKRFAPTAIVDEKVLEMVQEAEVVEENAEVVEQVAENVVGKWEIFVEQKDGKEIYTFELIANNGQLLLSSEEYTSYVGVINGINTHKTNIQKGNFSIQTTKKKVKNKKPEYFYLLLNANNQPLCLGEHYKTKASCERAIESVKRFSANSPTYMNGKVVTD